MDWLDQLVNSSLEGTVATIEFSGLPSVSVDLSPSKPGIVSPMLKALRPRITVTHNGQQVVSTAPYGNPEEGTPWGLIGLGIVGVVVLVLVMR